MDEEQEANVTDAELTEKSEQEQPVAEPTEQDAKIKEYEDNMKALQRNLADRETKLADAQRRGNDTEAIKQQLAEVREALAQQVDYTNWVVQNLSQPYGAEANFEPGTTGARQNIPTPTLDAFKQKSEQEKAEQQKREEAKRQEDAFWEAISEAGYSDDKDFISKVTDDFKLSPAEALRKLPKLVREAESTRMKDEEKRLEEEKKKIAREKAEAAGELDTPVASTPAGKGGIPRTKSEFNKYVSGLSMKEYEQQKDELNRLWSSGEIK